MPPETAELSRSRPAADGSRRVTTRPDSSADSFDVRQKDQAAAAERRRDRRRGLVGVHVQGNPVRPGRDRREHGQPARREALFDPKGIDRAHASHEAEIHRSDGRVKIGAERPVVGAAEPLGEDAVPGELVHQSSVDVVERRDDDRQGLAVGDAKPLMGPLRDPSRRQSGVDAPASPVHENQSRPLEASPGDRGDHGRTRPIVLEKTPAELDDHLDACHDSPIASS